MDNQYACFLAQALFDFETEEANELKFKTGDVLVILNKVNEDWYSGKLVASVGDCTDFNLIGIFPSNFVQRVQIPENSNKKDALYLALYDFPKVENDDLEFSKADILVGKQLINDEWFLGCKLNDQLKSGIFPLTHVTKIDEEYLIDQSSANESIYETIDHTFSDSLSENICVQARVIEDFINYDKVNNDESDTFKYLNLKKDNVLIVTKKIDSFWLEGENLKGDKGIFPARCIQIIQENETEEHPAILNRTQRHIYMNANSIDETTLKTNIDDYLTNLFKDAISSSDDDNKSQCDTYENLDTLKFNEVENNAITARSEIYESVNEEVNEALRKQTSIELDQNYETLTSNNDSLKTLTVSIVDESMYTTAIEPLRPPPLPPKPEFLKSKYSNNSSITQESKFVNNIMKRIDEIAVNIKNEKTKNKEENNNDIDIDNENKEQIEMLKEEFTKLTDAFLKIEPEHEFVKNINKYKQEIANKSDVTLVEKPKFEKDNQRKNIIIELMETEKDYFEQLNTIYTCFLDSSLNIKIPEAFSLSLLLSNLHEILQVSSKFIDLLEAEKDKNDENVKIGSCLIKCAGEMQQYYAIYCRDFATTNDLIKKYENNKEINEYINFVLQKIKNVIKNLSLSALLIKPVQRITKYSLFIDQLIKKTPEHHCDYLDLKEAATIFNCILVFINEYKRRKDLILKYRNKEDNRNIFEKITMNTLRKKSNRLGMRISTVFGLYDQTVDIRFNFEEEKFRCIERDVKTFINESNNILTHFKEMLDFQVHVNDDLIELYSQDEKQKGAIFLFKNVLTNFINNKFDLFIREMYEKIWTPLTDLISCYEMPNLLIDKRYNKLLDYDKARGDNEKAKLNERTKEANAFMEDAKKTYEALNNQLLDELPVLTHKSTLLLGLTMKTFSIMFTNVLRALKADTSNLEKELELPGGPFSVETIKQYLNSLKLASIDERRESNQFLLPYQNTQTEEQQNKLKQTYDSMCIYKAVRNHDSDDQSLQISVNKGDIVAVIKKSNPLGKKDIWFCDNGETKGFLPANTLVPFDKPNRVSLVIVSEDAPDEAHKTTNGNQAICTVLYDFNAFKSNMLTIKKGDTLVVVEKHDRKGDIQWWLVETFDGGRGYVPYNYVSLIE